MISNNDSLHNSGHKRGDGNGTIISRGEWFGILGMGILRLPSIVWGQPKRTVIR